MPHPLSDALFASPRRKHTRVRLTFAFVASKHHPVLPILRRRWGAGTFEATPAADDGELDLVPGAPSVDHDAFALGSNPRGGGGGVFVGAPVAPGSPTQASHHRRGATAAHHAPVAFSFEPEDDPVVCRMVNAAQEQARARVAAAKAEAEARAAEAEAEAAAKAEAEALAAEEARQVAERLGLGLGLGLGLQP